MVNVKQFVSRLETSQFQIHINTFKMKGLFTKALLFLLALGSQAASCQLQTKRVVQYYGQQVNDRGTKFHIDLLVNNPDNKTYATNVLMGEFGIYGNKTLGLNGVDPDAKAND